MNGGSPGRRWSCAVYGYGLAVSMVLAYFLLRIPIQLTDTFTTILALEQPFTRLMHSQFLQAGYLRPAMWAELKLVYELSGGEYYSWFRTTQALQAAAAILLLIRFVRPRSAPAAAAVFPMIGALTGSHTFAWTVREAYPINTFLTVLVCCALAANLASGRRGFWNDAGAVVLFVVAALTLESGLLVWVILAGAWGLGLRGVSRGCVIALTALLGGYFLLRFAVLGTGVPGLNERDSGFGFVRYTPSEITAMFGSNPLPFYAYNVGSAVLSVLAGEPRDGVFRLTQSLVDGRLSWPLLIGSVASLITTGLIGRYVWIRRRALAIGEWDDGDRIVLLFPVVLLANAAMSYAYAKDVILSPAGWFFAAAAYVATRHAVEHEPVTRFGRAGLTLLLAVLASAWAVRAGGLYAALDATAGKVRQQWAYVDEWVEVVGGGRALSPSSEAMKRRLQEDAVIRHPWRPPIRETFTRLFELE